MNEHLKLLGLLVRDAVTGMKGYVTSISFDLYGCVQAVVQPVGVNDKGEMRDGRWFDTKRLIAESDTPIMEVPTFETVPGGQELPTYGVMPNKE